LRPQELSSESTEAQSLPKHPANILRQNEIRSLAGLASPDSCALTLILALTVAVVLVARRQQEGVPAILEKTSRAPGRHADTNNLTAIIDIGNYYHG
jgi:hypothetical protein